MNCVSLFSKKTVFQRPYLPTGEHILEDLKNASDDDIAFKILHKDDKPGEGHPSAINFDLYKEIRTYLRTRKRIKSLPNLLFETEISLRKDKDDINCLAKNLRQRAQEALNI